MPIDASDAGDVGNWTAACSLDRSALHPIICVQVAAIDLLIVRDKDHIYACERACPHEQADLAQGRVSDGRLFCPRHQAWFSLHNGEISPGWPSRSLRRYPVRIAEGQIWIKVDPSSDNSDAATVGVIYPVSPTI